MCPRIRLQREGHLGERDKKYRYRTPETSSKDRRYGPNCACCLIERGHVHKIWCPEGGMRRRSLCRRGEWSARDQSFFGCQPMFHLDNQIGENSRLVCFPLPRV